MLDLCRVYNKMSKYEIALQYCQQAVQTIKDYVGGEIEKTKLT